MTSPEKYGFDAARLGRIPVFLRERYLDTGTLPNAQLLIARDGEIVHFSSQGAAREGAVKPIDEGSIFRIASMTKPITSLGFMMLVEKGKVALDTPVHHVLPEFEGLGVYNGGGGAVPFLPATPIVEPMRMVDLLRHTSGLTYGFQNRSNVDAAYRAERGDADHIPNWYARGDLDEFVAGLGRLPLEFAPGKAWNYSVATDVLGAVIQRVSGLPLDRYLAERIFQPLRMDDTGFVVPGAKADRLTDCYAFAPGKGRVMYDRGEESVWLAQPDLVSGGGGLTSTALDYHRFCRMCANGGELDGARLVGRKTIELMTMNHLPGKSDLATLSRSMFSETTNAGVGFGLGFAVTQDLIKAMIPGSAGEYYWGGIFSTSFFIDPVENLHAVFMTQLSPSTAYPIRRELKTLIYSALS